LAGDQAEAVAIPRTLLAEPVRVLSLKVKANVEGKASRAWIAGVEEEAVVAALKRAEEKVVAEVVEKPEEEEEEEDAAVVVAAGAEAAEEVGGVAGNSINTLST
jgi:hypothetical protein